MHIFGIGIHLLIAAFFAVHAVRNRQPMYWLLILFSFPLLGSVVYFFAIYLPNSRIERRANQLVSAATRVLDPTRELREARAAFEFTPTAQNQMRLAAALLEAGEAAQAASTYEASLAGPFAHDPRIRVGAARAYLACRQPEPALAHLLAARAAQSTFQPEEIALLLARSYAAAGRDEEARAEFESALARFGSFEARVEYALWALESGQKATADRLLTEIDSTVSHWSRPTRELNAALLRRLDIGRAAARP